jgi:FdhD protein
MAKQKTNQKAYSIENNDTAININLKQRSKPVGKVSPSLEGVEGCSRQQVEGTQVTLSIDSVIVEEPLQIRLIYHDRFRQKQDRIYLVTMRTPGDDLYLVTGLLLAEGVIKYANEIIAINDQLDAKEVKSNEINIHLSSGIVIDWDFIKRDTTSFSSCGVCGKSSIHSLELRDIPKLEITEGWLSESLIQHFSEQLRQSQSMFSQTGGSHGCALFNERGELLFSAEDVGRHNALDKLIGKLSINTTIDSYRKIVFLSGRISFELVQKVLVAGISVLIAVGAPSNLAINMAKRFNLTLIGFSRNDRFNVYHGAFRLNLNAS